MVCASDRLPAVLAGVRQAHSYEEPAIDVYPLQKRLSFRVIKSNGRSGVGHINEYR